MFQKLKAIQERYRKVIISIPPKLYGIRFHNNNNEKFVAGSLILLLWALN
jgi:hypothetical protein